MSQKIKVAILSVSAGAGHVRAAQALERVIADNYSDVEAVHLDVMDYVPKLFRKLYAESYVYVINRYPALWGYMYDKSDQVRKESSLIKKIRVAIERLNTKKLLSKMIELKPDVIISTHFLPPELISRMIRKGASLPPSWVQVTDFDLHGLWVHDFMTGYFAASDEVAFRMRNRGIPEDRITVTGIPIMPSFRKRYSRTECASEIGVDPEKFTILLMAGGLGVGGVFELTEHLMKMEKDFQVISLAGKNTNLLSELKKLSEKYPERLFPIGFTKTIERVMAVSDLAVTKPGGLTSSECLAVGLPMIVIAPIPGQEERNSDYLLENGTAIKANDPIGVEYKIRELLGDPGRLQRMSENALKISRPDAAERVLEKVIKDISEDK
jgi:processive 1,2-diacylglycerol beta-glucosyltransferase